MKTKSIKKLTLKKRAVAELTTSDAIKGGTGTTTTIVTVFCNTFIAGEDYNACGGGNMQ